MSIALMTLAWALDVGSTDKLVLLALADNANDAGVCWPSMATIARKCGLSERAARLAVRRLEQAGHVRSTDRCGSSRLYTVHPGTSCPPERRAPRNDVPVTPAPGAPKPSRTTSSSTKTSSSPKNRARAAPPIELPPWIPREAWEGWIEMRNRKRKPLTGRAAGDAIEKLKALADAGHPPGDVLDQSTFEAWTGLFPIKDNRNGLLPRNDHAGAQHRSATDSLRGARPDPALDMLRAARAAEEADGAAGGRPDDRGAWPALPSGGSG